MASCATCKFKDPDNNQCRISPPKAEVCGYDPELQKPLIVTVFPIIRPESDWCGAHIPNLAIAQ